MAAGFVLLAAILSTAAIADTNAPSITLRATVINPGKLALAMWTLKMLAEPVAITAGAVLTYDEFVSSTSIRKSGGVELEGGTLQSAGIRDDNRIVDQAGETLRGGDALGSHAGAWYTRRFDLSAAAGKSFSKFRFFSAESDTDNAGTYEARLRNVRITDNIGKILASYDPSRDGFPLAVAINMSVDDPAVTANGPVATVSAAVKTPGTMCCSMWTLKTIDPPVSIPPGSFLVYEVRVGEGGIGQLGGVELEGPGLPGGLRDDARAKDQAEDQVRGGYFQTMNTGLWYRRYFDLSPYAGQTFAAVRYFSSEYQPKTAGTYHADIRNIALIDAAHKVIMSLQPSETSGFPADANNMTAN